jgi:TolB protein
MSKLRFLIALLALGIAAPAWSQAVDPFSMPTGKCDPTKGHCVSAIVFSSPRDAPTLAPVGEIYLMTMNEDGTFNDDEAVRLTENEVGVHGFVGANGLAKLSPHRKRPHRENGARATRFTRRSWRDHRLPFDTQLIVFDSNRNRLPSEPVNTSDLFLMNTDGQNQMLLTRGSSATWSPNGKYIAFHRSASGDACPVFTPPLFPGIPGCPIKIDPGAATWDSDIFIMRVPDLDADVIEEPINITNTLLFIEEDADWSPDGKKIVFTRHAKDDYPVSQPFNYHTGEICVLDLETPDPEPQCLLGQATNNNDERGPAWSPDGARIAYMCRNQTTSIFDICVMDAAGETHLTDNSLLPPQDRLHGTPSWSPDGTKILFQRGATMVPSVAQLWLMNADGTDQTQLTPHSTSGANTFASWGQLWVGGGGPQ